MIGMPYSRWIASPAAISFAARRQTVSYTFAAIVSKSGWAQPRRLMPSVMVRMSRFSICTMRMVSTISWAEKGMGIARWTFLSLNPMHVLEDVLVLGVDAQPH